MLKYYVRLEAQAQTENHREWTWINAVVDTTEHFRVDAFILGDGEHVVHSSVEAACDTIVAATLEEVLEAVAHGDVVELEERCVLYPAVAEGRIHIVGCCRAGIIENDFDVASL